jgi:predicted nucleotidyltransferase
VTRRERLDGAELERYLERIARALVAAMSPERVILFGSFARGDQNRASDLDLVVIAASDLPFTDRIGVALAACTRASQRLPIEALVYTPAEWLAMLASGNSFARLVEREGRVLYERQPQPGGNPPLAPASSARS